MKKAKIILIISIPLTALIVSLQNTEAVGTKFLLMTVTMPRVLLLLLTFTLGVVGGLIAASFILRKPDKSKEKTKTKGNHDEILQSRE
jgi:uncharacterized integral membrane protein